MHFDGWNTIEGRHLVFAYAAVLVIHGSYFTWIMTQWSKIRSAEKRTAERT